MILERRHVRFLASVTSESEAGLAAACGADIIDCKNPATGALGALPASTVAAVRRRVPGGITVSATVGDLACEPETVAEAVSAMAATGVDYVKIGLFDGGAEATIVRVGKLPLGRTRLVGVLIADSAADLSLIAHLARAGFAGVMLDTAGKDGRSLLDHTSPDELSAFVRAARECRLFAGLAGSLSLSHVPHLLPLEPDMLGFRGALCRGADRTGAIDEAALRAIRRVIPRAPSDAALIVRREAGNAPGLQRTPMNTI